MNNCARCDASLPERTGRGRPAKFCGKACSRAHFKANNKRVCEIPDCGKTHLASGLCGTHYNRTLPNRHPKATYECAGCGASVIKDAGRDKKYSRLFCSEACHHRKRSAEAHAVVAWEPRPTLHSFIDRMPGKPKKGRTRVITAGYCRTCAAPFADMYGSVTCSESCQALSHRASKQDGKHRRRARQRGAFIAPVRRNAVYERDGWTCQLCYLPVDREAVAPDRMAPTIDHILALANGGTHEPSNVQTAHFICNALKGDREWTDVRVGRA
jgi:hypothetical protein